MAGDSAAPEWHTLDFFSDESGSSALTIFSNGTRLHIIADAEQLRTESKAGKGYHELVSVYRHQSDESAHTEAPSKDHSPVDSGIDVDDDSENSAEKQGPKPVTSEDPESALKKWMITPLSETLRPLVSDSKVDTRQTTHDWYHCPTKYFELRVSTNGDHIDPVELEKSPHLEEKMLKLLPQAVLPRYLTDKLKVPTYEAKEFTVLTASDQPAGTPYHPCRVQHIESERVSFLKVVDNAQPQPLKRELDILHRVHELGLHKQISVPQLQGLVAFDNTNKTRVGQQRIMGFLLADISDPAPLTTKLDTDVPQGQREAWAEEADRTKQILHDNGIIWGDAKADNFMVDASGKLWIIDFGGSYTEGWVDPELNETKEGDDMGTEKIVNALKDPEKYTYEPDEEGEERQEGTVKTEVVTQERSGGETERGVKRARVESEDVDDDHSSHTAKAVKKSTSADNDDAPQDHDGDDS